MKPFLPALLLSLLFCACTKKSTEGAQAAGITMTAVNLPTDSLQLSAQLRISLRDGASDAGFIWSTNDLLPGPDNIAGTVHVSNPQLSFTARIDNQFPDRHYLFRAYVVSGTQTFYSDPVQYSTPSRGSWQKRKDFPGAGRSFPMYFTLNGKGYLCGGWDGSAALKDCWSFDPDSGQWTQLPDFPGAARSDAFFFVIGNTAYCGGGTMQNPELPSGFLFTDVYAFDGTGWTKRNDFPNQQGGYGIYGTYHFSANGFGYVGGGAVGYQTAGYALWQYDPGSDNWTVYDSNPYDERNHTLYDVVWPAWFVLGDTLFVGNGVSDYSRVTAADYFFRYDIHAKTWAYRGTLPGGAYAFNTGFVNGGTGYFAYDLRSPNGWRYQYSDIRGLFEPTSASQDHYFAYGSFAFTIGAETWIGMGDRPGNPVPFKTVYSFTGTP